MPDGHSGLGNPIYFVGVGLHIILAIIISDNPTAAKGREQWEMDQNAVKYNVANNWIRDLSNKMLLIKLQKEITERGICIFHLFVILLGNRNIYLSLYLVKLLGRICFSVSWMSLALEDLMLKCDGLVSVQQEPGEVIFVRKSNVKCESN